MKIEIMNLFEELEKAKTENDKKRYIEIRNKIAEKNLKLVYYRVPNTYKKDNDIDDIVEAGNEGLLKAIEKYDITIGTEFSTYAIPWIDQYIRMEIKNNSNWGKVPMGKFDTILNARRKLERQNKECTPKEISLETGIEEEEVILILRTLAKPMSLNYQTEDCDNEAFEIIPSKETPVEEIAEKSILRKEILDLLRETLNDNQLRVIIKRYGLNNEIPQTLEEIAQELNVTRERVRQLEIQSLRLLKKGKGIEKFSIYMDKPDKYKKK